VLFKPLYSNFSKVKILKSPKEKIELENKIFNMMQVKRIKNSLES